MLLSGQDGKQGSELSIAHEMYIDKRGNLGLVYASTLQEIKHVQLTDCPSAWMVKKIIGLGMRASKEGDPESLVDEASVSGVLPWELDDLIGGCLTEAGQSQVVPKLGNAQHCLAGNAFQLTA